MNWYYALNGEQKGPVDDAALAALADAGTVNDTTLVWNQSLSGWQAYGTVRPAAPPPPPLQAEAAAAPPAATGYCTNCGRQYLTTELVSIAGLPVCAICKPSRLQQVREGAATTPGRVYAGFWIRFAAHLIDAVIVAVANSILGAILGFVLAFGGGGGGAVIALIYLLSFGTSLAYVSWFLVNKNATLGKIALGLRVIRTSNAPITYPLAVGRELAKILSGLILLIGYIMAAWDPEHRALHDRICDTRVIRA